MDKNYTKAKQFTNIFVKIYLSMADLEKAKQTYSKEYKNLTYILMKRLYLLGLGVKKRKAFLFFS